MIEIELHEAGELQAANRSRLYALLAEAFATPTRAGYERIRSGEFRAAVEEAARGLPYALACAGGLGQGLPLTFDEFQADYIALFEVGRADGPPCSLYEGEHGGGRMKVIEETLRFYHHFGLGLSGEKGKWDRPDHLATELEFLHGLTFREAEALRAGRSVEAYRKAQRDFLRFHVAGFASAVAGPVASRGVPFYSDVAGLGSRFCREDHEYVKRVV